MNTSTHPSRRAVAKGAAWAVPAVAVSTITPAYAASTDNYLFRASAYSSFGCEAGLEYGRISNQEPLPNSPTSPFGFSVVNTTNDYGTGTSASTTATLQGPFTFTYTVPA